MPIIPSLELIKKLTELFEWCNTHCCHCDEALPEAEQRCGGTCPYCGGEQTYHCDDDVEYPEGGDPGVLLREAD